MNKSFMDEFIDSSIAANQEIYKLINTFPNDLKESKTLGYGGDISIMIDLKAEEIFVKYLSKYGKIFSEESGEQGEGEFTIVVDPLDGSNNFKANFPYFGSSVALKDKDGVKVAVVTNLANQDLFIKTDESFVKGKLFKSTFENIKKNSFSEIGVFEKAYKSKIYAKKLREKGVKYRVPGAFALSLAYGHDLRFVIFEGKVREFDACAGRFMCSDLYLYESDEIFIVSQDEATFRMLRDMI